MGALLGNKCKKGYRRKNVRGELSGNGYKLDVFPENVDDFRRKRKNVTFFVLFYVLNGGAITKKENRKPHKGRKVFA